MEETAADAGARGPLAGLRVLELSTVLAGPYCAMVLADLGAEVVKVEPVEGDATRHYGPPWVGPAHDGGERVAAYFLSVNRNKRSLRLDLRREEARAVVGQLVGRSDVLIENFRPGGMEKIGMSEHDLRALNPAIVHLSITGYGPDGPDSSKPGYDFVAQAVGGLMSITGFPDDAGGHPTKVGVAITDIVTGLLGTIGVLAALRSGVGQRIDVSLLEATLATLINQAQNAFVSGEQPQRRGNAHPNIVPYETYATSDGQLAVAVGSERQWPRLCAVIGLPELATDARFTDNDARVRNREVLRPIIAEQFAEADTEHWRRQLDEAGVPCGPVNDVLAAFDMPQSVARGMRTAVTHPTLGEMPQIGVPFKLSATPASIRSAPPLLGEHADEILAELGYDPAAIQALRDSGVI